MASKNKNSRSNKKVLSILIERKYRATAYYTEGVHDKESWFGSVEFTQWVKAKNIATPNGVAIVPDSCLLIRFDTNNTYSSARKAIAAAKRLLPKSYKFDVQFKKDKK